MNSVLERDGLRVMACGDDVSKLAKTCYKLQEEWHRRDPELHAAPDLFRARAVAEHYIAEMKRIGEL